ncbi:hypothetical protein LINGRAHAP2_LOCUS6798 [Linum grandiflorum]
MTIGAATGRRQTNQQQRAWEFSVDAAVNNLDCHGALGLVLRKVQTGSLISANGLGIPYLSDPLTLELMAIRRALLASIQQQDDRISILLSSSKTNCISGWSCFDRSASISFLIDLLPYHIDQSASIPTAGDCSCMSFFVQ